jgi:hypothetical protein
MHCVGSQLLAAAAPDRSACVHLLTRWRDNLMRAPRLKEYRAIWAVTVRTDHLGTG